MLRLLPRDVKRIDANLLVEIGRRVASHGSVDEYLCRCEDASIFCLGDRSRKGFSAGGQGAYAYDEGPGEAQAPAHWPIHTTGALSRVGLSLQKKSFWNIK